MAAGGRASEQKGLYSGRRSKVNGMWSAVKLGVEWRRGAQSSYSGFLPVQELHTRWNFPEVGVAQAGSAAAAVPPHVTVPRVMLPAESWKSEYKTSVQEGNALRGLLNVR